MEAMEARINRWWARFLCNNVQTRIINVPLATFHWESRANVWLGYFQNSLLPVTVGASIIIKLTAAETAHKWLCQCKHEACMMFQNSSDPYIYSRKLSFFIAERPQSSSSMGNMLLTKNECCYLQSELPTYHSSEITSAGVYVENTRDFPMKLPGFKTWQPV